MMRETAAVADLRDSRTEGTTFWTAHHQTVSHSFVTVQGCAVTASPGRFAMLPGFEMSRLPNLSASQWQRILQLPGRSPICADDSATFFSVGILSQQHRSLPGTGASAKLGGESSALFEAQRYPLESKRLTDLG